MRPVTKFQIDEQRPVEEWPLGRECVNEIEIEGDAGDGCFDDDFG